MGRIVVTGGAGYVGSHIVRILVDAGEEVTVIDDLSNGHREAAGGARLVEATFDDAEVLEREITAAPPEFIVHMAALCEVGESMKDPASYYRTNLLASLNLLEAARRAGVRGIVFSSTAAVYGEPVSLPITEEHPQLPTNTYGETKLAFERALAWYHQAYGLSYTSLRYFNAAGAHPDGSIGEDHSPESHLIPRLLRALTRESDPMPVFGTDYPTPDGTCVRDYVHVMDLAQAHVVGLQAMRRERSWGEVFNLGNGEGFSVREIIDTVEGVTGQRPPTCDAPRRPGDPARLVASSERIVRKLGWRPDFPTPREIIATAWNWHRSHPRGYGDRG